MTDANTTSKPITSFAEFAQRFQSDIAPALLPLERQREAALAQWNKAIGIFFVLGAIVALLTALHVIPLVGGGVGLVIVVAIAFAYRSSCYAPFIDAYKSQVVSRLVKSVHSELEYGPNRGISVSEFEGSGIFTEGVDRYACEDEIKGWVEKTQIRCSEVHAEYKTESRDSKGRRQTQWHTIFRGFFVLVDFNKHFKGNFVVLPDSAESTLGGIGRWFQSMNVSRDQLIRMDDPDFEKAFVVYGTDQVEARYILSTALMQRILDVRKRSGANIHIAFTQSVMCLALSRSHDAFEPQITETLLKPDTHRRHVEDVMFLVGLVADLNLNTRIWTKE